MHWLGRLAGAIVVAIAVIAGAVCLALVGIGTARNATAHDGLPAIDLQPLAQRSEIVAADGSLLSAMYEQDRTPARLSEVPQHFVDAVVAVEDSAFYEHDGVSVRGLLRAVRANATGGRIEQGGSTITQQLVKNSMLTSDRSYDRKAREAVLAIRMEHELTKDQILERYLNTVYFGQGAYGVRAAAQRYFSKDLATLTVGESALLAGMISSPQAFDPVRAPDAARTRRAHALTRMVKLHQISQADADTGDQEPLPTAVKRDDAQPNDHFTEEVRRQLLADERLGATPEQRLAMVLRGGIRVETTVDPALQASAEQAVREGLPPSQFTAALVAIDPSDGSVRALVGGPNFEQAKYNLATQGARQAGSSFKTIALAAWLASGHSPEDLVDATAPCEFPMPAPEPPWHVDNYDGESSGVLITTLREATVKSSNCAYARVSLALGPEKLADMAKRLGITRPLPPVASIVLGTGEVSPLEMASVYATLAADGVRHTPVFIRRVVGPDGQVLFENNPTAEQVIDPSVARTVTEVLRGVVTRGTGRRADIGRPAAGKTGTAQEWRDAWFAGYTPQLATAIWMGSAVGQESMRDVGGIHVTGGSYPAMIWSRFMGVAVGALPVADFASPDPAAWPPSAWIGTPPAVLPPGFVLPAHLVPVPVAPVVSPPVVVAPPPTPSPSPRTQPTEQKRNDRGHNKRND